MVVSLIAAIDENRGLGKSNQLLFKIPEDMKRFKQLTEGHAVIMGRKTFESIGRPLPNRKNIVITSNNNFEAENCSIVHSLDEALTKAREIEHEEIFVIGGGQIYKEAIGKADKLYLTIVKGTYDADTFFPDYSQFSREVTRVERQNDPYTYSFVDLVK